MSGQANQTASYNTYLSIGLYTVGTVLFVGITFGLYIWPVWTVEAINSLDAKLLLLTTILVGLFVLATVIYAWFHEPESPRFTLWCVRAVYSICIVAATFSIFSYPKFKSIGGSTDSGSLSFDMQFDATATVQETAPILAISILGLFGAAWLYDRVKKSAPKT